MTAQEVVLDLLRYIGVTGFTAVENDQALNRPGVDTDDVNKALAAVNGGLSLIQEHGPQSMKFGERAAYYGSPTSIQISAVATQGQSATATATPPAWMLGCSILLDGDSDLNRVMDITGNVFSFLRGYRGSTGMPIGATVYFDCALLSDEIAAVLAPVAGSPNLELRPARSLEEFNRFTLRNLGQGNAVVETPNRQPGVPALYLVERRRGGDLFLRVTPMPGSPFNATFQAKLNAEQIDEDVLDLTGSGDPAYEFTSLRPTEVTSLLLPLARWLFFAHPALKNAETRASVKVQYDAVMMKLGNGSAFEPAVHDNHAEYI